MCEEQRKIISRWVSRGLFPPANNKYLKKNYALFPSLFSAGSFISSAVRTKAKETVDLPELLWAEFRHLSAPTL